MNLFTYGLAYISVPLVMLMAPFGKQVPVAQTDASPATVEAEQPDEPSSTEPVAAPAEAATPAPTCETQRECNEQIVYVFTVAEWGEGEWPAMRQLVMKESGFRHTAQNPKSTAYGMFQFLNSTWKPYGCEKTSDPITQTECGIAYIKARYGTPTKALQFHRNHNWY